MKTYETFVNNIKRGQYSPVYLLHGSEEYLHHKAIAVLKDNLLKEQADLNFTLLDGEQVKLREVVEAANTLPFFAERRLVVVLAAPYFKNKRKKDGEEEDNPEDDSLLLEYLQEPNPLTCLVFVTKEGVNSRKKLYKAAEKNGQVLEFAQLKGRDIEDWVRDQFKKRGKIIEPKALQYLLSVNSNDMGVLNGEVEKLCLLDLSSETVSFEQVKQAASVSAEASIFDLLDLIATRKSAQAVEKLREILGQGEPPLLVLFMISRQLRLILAAKSLSHEGYAQNQLAGMLGIHPYACQKVISQGKFFNFEQLQLALEICLEINLALKTGKGTPAMLLELGIINIGMNKPLELLA